ncbi:MAG TPA: DUF4349 domain-containing protein [bacterium]|nr:DUF4349 domain-containing protein [bacterium]
MPATHMKELLSPFLDGALSGREHDEVQRHVEGCAECRAHLESLRRTAESVRSLDPVKVPEGFQAQVRARLSAADTTAPRRWLPRWSWPVAAAAAAVLLVGVFSANLLREMRPVGQVAPEDFRAEPAVPRPSDVQAPSLPAPAGPQALPPVVDVRKIVRTAELALDVDRFDEVAARLLQTAERAGGYVAESAYAEDGGVPQGTFTLRVPAARFAAVTAEVEGLGTVTHRRIGGQDVTEEFVDLQARIRNLERHEQRLLSFMDRATKVSDLLAIEEQLARVRGEIEQLTGRLRFLERSADLASIAVMVRQKVKTTSGVWDFSGTIGKMRAAFLATVRQILSGVEWLGVTASALAPVLLLAAGFWLVIRFRRRARTSEIR